MHQRIKEIRKALKLNQEDFAKKIGLAQNSYSAIETGRNQLSEQNIKLICFTFGINEEWLRSGKGTMFLSTSPSEELEILEIFRQLSPGVQDLFLEYGHILLKNEEVLRAQFQALKQAADQETSSVNADLAKTESCNHEL